MGGRFQTCIAATDEPYIHKSASDVVCRDSGQLSGHCCSQTVEMIQKHGTRCKSVHLATDVMSCTLEKPKNKDCKLLQNKMPHRRNQTLRVLTQTTRLLSSMYSAEADCTSFDIFKIRLGRTRLLSAATA